MAMGIPEDLVRLSEDASAEYPYTVEVDNDVEGWKAIAWGEKREAGEAIVLSVQVALREAYNMGLGANHDLHRH
jgi:hypothetical protein